MDGANEQDSSAQSTRFRSRPRYIIWMISSIATLIIAVTKELSVLTLIFMLLALYCIECFITEVFGVSVDETGITVPNRLFPNNP
jgi:hypothetical protein